MQQDEREVPDQPEGKEKEQGGGAPVPGGVAGAEGGLARGAASSEQKGVSGAGNDDYHAAAGSESDDEEDVEAIFTSVRRVAILHYGTPRSSFRSWFVVTGSFDGGVGRGRSGEQCWSWQCAGDGEWPERRPLLR